MVARHELPDWLDLWLCLPVLHFLRCQARPQACLMRKESASGNKKRSEVFDLPAHSSFPRVFCPPVRS